MLYKNAVRLPGSIIPRKPLNGSGIIGFVDFVEVCPASKVHMGGFLLEHQFEEHTGLVGGSGVTGPAMATVL
jgi:hypothetical protein